MILSVIACDAGAHRVSYLLHVIGKFLPHDIRDWITRLLGFAGEIRFDALPSRRGRGQTEKVGEMRK